jgi:hypothetical protein
MLFKQYIKKIKLWKYKLVVFSIIAQTKYPITWPRVQMWIQEL